MPTCLARELELRFRPPRPTASAYGNYDPMRACEHTPADTYTREPCSCGRELWPPRGRGRGESLTSPRRIAAKMKALDALELHAHGWTYERIARRLGYRDASGAWRAVQRIRDQEAAWRNYEARTGHKPYSRHQPTRHELEQAAERLTREIREHQTHTTLDEQCLRSARLRLVRHVLADLKQ